MKLMNYRVEKGTIEAFLFLFCLIERMEKYNKLLFEKSSCFFEMARIQ